MVKKQRKGGSSAPKPSTKTELVRDTLLEFPGMTASQVAARCGTSEGFVRNIKTSLRAAGAIAAANTQAGTGAAPSVAERVRGILKKKPKVSIDQLSDALNVGVGKIKEALEELKAEGMAIQVKDRSAFIASPERFNTIKLDIPRNTAGVYKFGACGDNHLGSKYAREDVLNEIYDEFERQGVTTVFNTGNWIDGEARFNKHDLLDEAHGLDAQIGLFVKRYPQRKGITTRYIAGDDHEGWYFQNMGIDIGKYAELKAQEAGRKDLVYCGYMEADYQLPEGTIIRTQHPGGGSSYAISYTSQKIVESLSGGEKPNILLVGHYHKAEYLYTRGVHVIQTGCTQDQTPFMRKKRLAAHVGAWIVEAKVDRVGAVISVKTEYFNFHDKPYYARTWKHK